GVWTTNTQTFIGPGLISIPEVGEATPYPHNLEVVDYSGVPDKVTVTLNGLSHAYPDDLDILLVGPRGEQVMLMSDVGFDFVATNVNLVLDDAAVPLPDSSPLRSGTFAPANYFFSTPANDLFPLPAPAGPYASTRDVFAGVDPNGTWSLFVNDDGQGDAGSIASGWSVKLWKF